MRKAGGHGCSVRRRGECVPHLHLRSHGRRVLLGRLLLCCRLLLLLLLGALDDLRLGGRGDGLARRGHHHLGGARPRGRGRGRLLLLLLRRALGLLRLGCRGCDLDLLQLPLSGELRACTPPPKPEKPEGGAGSSSTKRGGGGEQRENPPERRQSMQRSGGAGRQHKWGGVARWLAGRLAPPDRSFAGRAARMCLC